jgi:hypothetical protein
MDFIAADPEMRLHRYDSKPALNTANVVEEAPSTPSETEHHHHGEKSYQPGGGRVDQ